MFQDGTHVTYIGNIFATLFQLPTHPVNRYHYYSYHKDGKLDLWTLANVIRLIEAEIINIL